MNEDSPKPLEDEQIPEAVVVARRVHPHNKQGKMDVFEGQMMVAAQFSGPLPPPAILEHYNEIQPGAADRIIRMAEEQSAHRRNMEKIVTKAEASAQTLGPILGFVLAMTIVIGGIWLISKGLKTEGLVAIIAAIAAPVGVFVYGKHQQQKELESTLENTPKKPKNHGRRKNK